MKPLKLGLMDSCWGKVDIKILGPYPKLRNAFENVAGHVLPSTLVGCGPTSQISRARYGKVGHPVGACERILVRFTLGAGLLRAGSAARKWGDARGGGWGGGWEGVGGEARRWG
ncbi:hypothetical protein GOBAR_AA27108 [Gossypium barbadense]|uniref:Uncharacterized protein n=1 Tax=Gossypium barbadense TaxID=3634 RepID=A0A2P5WR38_GOSBA|nr:hypothetical protein GOBAR_AA27108 [Gossypium barbadense]